jgi:predicted dehydrogenase
MNKAIETVLVGAGNRGYETYGNYALQNPDKIKFVAVAEPMPERRERFAQAHNISSERCFTSWEDMMAGEQLAEALVNCTMDKMHVDSTLAALANGYQVLLEKPMATNPPDCVRLVQAAEKSGRMLQICHVLRYAPFFSTIHDIVQSGRIGDVITVEHKENVAFWHMAHSFVRGNWGNSTTSSPMLLAKCCHDLDILVWVLGRRCVRVSSFGTLTHFHPDNVSSDIPERCTDDCPVEPDCPYSALRQYLGENTGWPVSVISADKSYEARFEALKTGPYGRCVYRCDNDVVDHQVINMEFEGGLTVAFTMHGHSHDNCRTMRYSGAKATLRAHEGKGEIVVHDYLTGQEESVPPEYRGGGHGGGDSGLIASFVGTLRDPNSEALTSCHNSLESHLIAFASERSRLEGRVIDMEDYRKQLEESVANAIPY